MTSRHHRRLLHPLVALVAVGAAACSGSSPGTRAATSTRGATTSTASTVASTEAATTTVAVADTIVSRRWLEAVESIVRDVKPTPPESARLYAYAAGAYDDALQAEQSAAPMASRVVADVLEALRPDQHDTIEAVATKLGALDAAGRLPSAVDAVRQRYLARAANDGFTAATAPVEPDQDGLWHAVDNVGPFAPSAGQWSRWLVGATTFSVPAPPSPGSPEQDRQVAIVRRAVLARDARWSERINFWGGAPGTNAPAGIWQDVLWSETTRSETAHSSVAAADARYAHAQAILAMTIADAFMEAWKVKFTYWTARPNMVDPSIETAMKNPPFPGYVSGHATISAAAATVLGRLVPSKEKVWMADAAEARDSRLMAGIHFAIDNEQGFALGERVGNAAADALRLAAPSNDDTGLAAPVRLTIPDGVLDSSSASPDAPPSSAPAAPAAPKPVLASGDALTIKTSSHGISSESRPGALVLVSKPGYDRSMLFVVNPSELKQYTPADGWTMTVASRDPTWTPGECSQLPTVVVGSRYVTYLEPVMGDDPGTLASVQLVAFDLTTKRFTTYLTVPNDVYYSELTAVGDHLVDIRFVGDRPAPGVAPRGPLRVRRIDLAAGTYADVDIDGPKSTNPNANRWPFMAYDGLLLVHDDYGVHSEESPYGEGAGAPVDQIAPSGMDGDDQVFIRRDGAVHAKIHAYRGADVKAWNGPYGFALAGRGADTANAGPYSPGVYDVRSGTWDWAFASQPAHGSIFFVGAPLSLAA